MADRSPIGATNARAVPIYQTTSYVFNDTDHAARLFGLKEFGNIYTRIMNPTTDVLEKRIAALEGGVGALAFASGQAAETMAILNHRRRGRRDRFHHRACTAAPTTCSTTRCPSWASPSGSSTPNAGAVAAAITDKTKAVFSETIGNPDLHTLDISAVADVAHDGRRTADARQHTADAVPGAAVRSRRRHRCPLRDQVHRRPWDIDRRSGR